MKRKRNVVLGLLIAASLLFTIGCNLTGSDVNGNGSGTTPTAVTFESADATDGTSGTVDSTGLTLTFSVDPTTLAASDITVTGATKGALSGTGTTRSLAISDITVGNGETVSVEIASPSGFTLTGSPQTAVVYRELYIGMTYQGGVIAYIFQSGDPGYVSSETHGLIAAPADQSTGIGWISPWSTQDTWVPGGTGTVLGTGSANTDNIIAQAVAAGNSTPSSYAAGLARAHEGGGYNDWYLPSQDELNKLYLNRAAVGGFADHYYWSSSDFDDLFVWAQHFDTSLQATDYKSVNFRVRAVRAF